MRDLDGAVVKHQSGTPRPILPMPSSANGGRKSSRAVRDGKLEGVFADALPQSRSPALARRLGADKHQAVMDGLREMLTLTKRKLGSGRIVLANGIRAGSHLDLLDWEGIDGVMIEHFDAFGSTAPADLKADLDSMTLAASKGKFVVLKGWPGFSWMDQEPKGRSHAENLRLARTGDVSTRLFPDRSAARLPFLLLVGIHGGAWWTRFVSRVPAPARPAHGGRGLERPQRHP